MGVLYWGVVEGISWGTRHCCEHSASAGRAPRLFCLRGFPLEEMHHRTSLSLII